MTYEIITDKGTHNKPGKSIIEVLMQFNQAHETETVLRVTWISTETLDSSFTPFPPLQLIDKKSSHAPTSEN